MNTQCEYQVQVLCLCVDLTDAQCRPHRRTSKHTGQHKSYELCRLLVATLTGTGENPSDTSDTALTCGICACIGHEEILWI